MDISSNKGSADVPTDRAKQRRRLNVIEWIVVSIIIIIGYKLVSKSMPVGDERLLSESACVREHAAIQIEKGQTVREWLLAEYRNECEQQKSVEQRRIKNALRANEIRPNP